MFRPVFNEGVYHCDFPCNLSPFHRRRFFEVESLTEIQLELLVTRYRYHSLHTGVQRRRVERQWGSSHEPLPLLCLSRPQET